MTVPKITVVAGLAGVGKTDWICKNLTNNNTNILYFSPSTGNVPIDQIRLAADYPHVKVFTDGQEVEFLDELNNASVAYIELGFYLELGADSQLLNSSKQKFTYKKVAIIPPHIQDLEYHYWANEIFPGAPINTNISLTRMWRAPSSGQVMDEDSLLEFWYELTNGAYGNVERAKAIFDVADGRSLYADFVAGLPPKEFKELNLPRHLEGRPERFSGIEVLGDELNETAIKQTLEDCCLSDAAILEYQQQVKEAILEENITSTTPT